MSNVVLESEEISKELINFLSSNVLAEGVSVDENITLREIGVDSLALMQAILFLERQYQTTIPLELLTPENTNSVKSLSLCLKNHLLEEPKAS